MRLQYQVAKSQVLPGHKATLELGLTLYAAKMPRKRKREIYLEAQIHQFEPTWLTPAATENSNLRWMVLSHVTSGHHAVKDGKRRF